MTPVLSKPDMYRRLGRGEFGNFLPQWFSRDEWARDTDTGKGKLWMLRSMTPGGPNRANLTGAEVVEQWTGDEQCSQMCDGTTLWAEVTLTDTGMYVYAAEYPEGVWRQRFPYIGKSYERIAAVSVLKRYVDPASYDDLMGLLLDYPRHAVELSAFDRCIGSFPHRNTLIWEVRCY